MYTHRWKNGFVYLFSLLGNLGLPVLAKLLFLWIADFSKEIFGPIVSSWISDHYSFHGLVTGSIFLGTCLLYCAVCLLQTNPQFWRDTWIYVLLGIISGIVVYQSKLRIGSIPSERYLNLIVLSIIYTLILFIFKRLSVVAKHYGIFLLALLNLICLSFTLTPISETTHISTDTPHPTDIAPTVAPTNNPTISSLPLPSATPSSSPTPPYSLSCHCLYLDQPIPRHSWYVVKMGDNLSCIAFRAGLSTDALLIANKERFPKLPEQPDYIYPEWIFYIP